jgi:hypothetical protein
LEKCFNERWSVGDNRGYLDNYAEEVSYFDPILKELVVGRDKVIAHINSMYSNPHIVQAPGFQEAPLVDELAYSLAGGVPGGTAEGADRAAEQLGVVRGLVPFAKVQLQGVQEAPVPVGTARAGRSRAGQMADQLQASNGKWIDLPSGWCGSYLHGVRVELKFVPR